MDYSPGNHDYRGAYQPRTSSRPTESDAASALPRNLFIVVAVLGLASYGFSFGPVGGAFGWAGRFAALAALCAAFGLLAKQKPLPLLTAVLAAMGFLDGLSSVLTADPGWAMTVIVVLNAAQAVAAVVALLMWPKAVTEEAGSGTYQAYLDYYNQAMRHYYGQQAPAVQPEASQERGYGQASAEARAAASASGTQRPSQHGEYADFVDPRYGEAPQGERGRPSAQSVPPAGLPTSRPAQTSAGQPESPGEQSARPSSSP